MKSSLKIILLLLCLILPILSTRSRKIRKFRAQTDPTPTSAPVPEANKATPAPSSAAPADHSNTTYYKFLNAIVEQFKGNQKDIDGCFPDKWKVKTATDDAKSLPALEEAKTLFLYIEKNSDVSLSITKEFKSNVKDFYKKKLGLGRRFFLQSKAKGLKKFMKFKNTPIDEFSEKIKGIYEKMRDVFNTPMFKKVDKVLNCLKKTSTANAAATPVIETFLNHKVGFITIIPTFIDIFVELFEKWNDLKEVFNSYKAGLEATDVLVKWTKFGEFYGRLGHLIGLLKI